LSRDSTAATSRRRDRSSLRSWSLAERKPDDTIDVDSREEHAVAVWKATNAEGVDRSDSVTEWLRR